MKLTTHLPQAPSLTIIGAIHIIVLVLVEAAVVVVAEDWDNEVNTSPRYGL
jgi:hypothetical protein